jgi:hypothetical protein
MRLLGKLIAIMVFGISLVFPLVTGANGNETSQLHMNSIEKTTNVKFGNPPEMRLEVEKKLVDMRLYPNDYNNEGKATKKITNANTIKVLENVPTKVTLHTTNSNLGTADPKYRNYTKPLEDFGHGVTGESDYKVVKNDPENPDTLKELGSGGGEFNVDYKIEFDLTKDLPGNYEIELVYTLIQKE